MKCVHFDLVQLDKDSFTHKCKVDFRNFAEFVALHYAFTAREDTPYWKALKNKQWSDSIINLQNDSTTFMSGHAIEFDIRTAEREEDEEVLKFLRKLMEEIDENDWSKNVLITLISDAGTRTFAVEAGRSQESLRALAEEFTG